MHSFALVLKWFEVSVGKPSNFCWRGAGKRGAAGCWRGAGKFQERCSRETCRTYFSRFPKVFLRSDLYFQKVSTGHSWAMHFPRVRDGVVPNMHLWAKLLQTCKWNIFQKFFHVPPPKISVAKGVGMALPSKVNCVSPLSPCIFAMIVLIGVHDRLHSAPANSTQVLTSDGSLEPLRLITCEQMDPCPGCQKSLWSFPVCCLHSVSTFHCGSSGHDFSLAIWVLSQHSWQDSTMLTWPGITLYVTWVMV